MAPMAIWGLGAIGAAVTGWWQYHRIKPGDLIRVKTEILPTLMKVTSVQSGLIPSGEDIIKGTATGDIQGVTTDLKVPIQVRRKDVIQNITPRFL